MSAGVHITWRQLRAAAFVGGAGVMALEMASSRLLAPAFGTSLVVWANLIGVILAAMAAGYSLGGRLADARPAPEGLFGALGLGGCLASLLPLAGQAALRALSRGIIDTPISLILLSFAGVLAVVAPPVFLLAFATPFAIRLGARDVGHTGRVAGSLGAWSTAGSLVGTFVPAFLTIPLFGVRATLLGTAAVLVGTAAVGLRRWWLLAALLLPLGVALATAGPWKPGAGLLFEGDSPYQFVQVIHQRGLTVLVVNEGGGIQSAWRDGTPLTGMYYDAYLVLPYLLDRGGGAPVRILVVGAGGGTLLRQFDEVLGPRFRLALDGVEIDPLVASLGPRFFGLPAYLARRVHVADGRSYLRGAGRYDVIIVDAYANQLYIPFHLTTLEFFRLCRQHLAPGGILAMNVNATSPSSPLLLAVERTLRAALPHAYAAKVAGPYNYLLAASDRPLDPGERLQPGRLPPLLRAVGAQVAAGWRPASGEGGLLLTDDRAPVEFLTDYEVLRVARGMVGY